MCQTKILSFIVQLSLWNWIVANPLQNSEEKLGIPKFIREPPSIVFYFTSNDKRTGDQPTFFDLDAVVYPSNATVTIATARHGEAENYLFLPILRASTHIAPISSTVSFKHPYAVLRTSSVVTVTENHHDTQTWMARIFNVPGNTVLHLLASTASGTVRSRSIKLTQMELPGFPRYADESLSLLIGNTGRLVCHLPRAQPSIPTVSFYHNGARLDLSDVNRYRLIYLGGDGTGTPWEDFALREQESPSSHSYRVDPIFTKPMPSAAILLIHPLRLTDSGEYRCQARLNHKEVFAEQRTILNVTKPRQKVSARLQFSSDDPEISYLYSHLISSGAENLPASHFAESNSGTGLDSVTPTRVLTVPEGMNLTLFCTYEGAPIVSTRWFFDGPAANVQQHGQFGILSITSVSKHNEVTYTCAPHTPVQDASRKSFRIQVIKRKQLFIDPGPVITAERGQNISIRCGHSEGQKSATDSNNAPVSTPLSEGNMDFRQFQLGTDLGWYHNGKRIDIKQKYEKVYIEATSDATQLHIFNLSNHDQGLYQCWTLDSSGFWSTVASVVTIRREAVQFKELQEPRTEAGVIRERTQEGLTGHMTCNISSILDQTSSSQDSLELGTDDVVIVWYRGASDSEPIDLSGSQTGGIKYLRSTVDWASQILSVVNPKRLKDDGLYACKVYDRRTNSFLGEIKFELIIDTARENLAEDMRKDNSQHLTDHKSAPQTQMKNDQIKIQNILSEIPDIQDISSKLKLESDEEFSICKPNVRRMNDFTTTLHVSWSIINRSAALQVANYAIELRMLKTSGNRRFVKRESGAVVEHENITPSSSEGYWTLPTRIDAVILESEVCLSNKREIEPGKIYSLRVVGIAHPKHKTELDSELNLKSPWSDRISFENLVNVQPIITTLTAATKTQLNLEWQLSNKFTWKIPQIAADFMYIKFQALLTRLLLQDNSSFPQKSNWNSCYIDKQNQTSNVGQQIFLGSWTVNNDWVASKPFQTNIGNLEPNATYAVAIYGIMALTEDIGALQWYTLLSAEAIETTLTDSLISTDPMHIYPDNGKTKKPESVSVKSGKMGIKNEVINTKVPPEQESHILVVILGSLAGVLLVISLALIGLCVWYHIRTKRLVYQESTESPNKLGNNTSSVDLSSTPNAYLWNTTNPLLNFMDSSYQATFTGSPQMQHLGMSNPSLRQFAELQSLYQLAGCGTQAWSTLPFSPSDKSTQIQQQQHWVNPELASMPKSSEVQITGFNYLYNAATQSVVQPAVHRATKAEFSKSPDAKSLPCEKPRIGEGERASMDAQIRSPDEYFSTPDVSDNEIEEEPRIIQYDQSSSIYSHIGSESTLNELPPKLLDQRGCFSPQSPPPPPIGTGPLCLERFHSPCTKSPRGIRGISKNPIIQRPIPMYLSVSNAPNASFPKPALYTAPGPLPINQGVIPPGGAWLNHIALQASWLARQQQIAPNGPYPFMLHSPFPTTHEADAFYRTLPSRKANDIPSQPSSISFMNNSDEVNAHTKSEMEGDPSNPLVNCHDWRGVSNDLEIFSVKGESVINPANNEHPSSQFILKYWGANNSDKLEHPRTQPNKTRCLQSSKSPCSSNNGLESVSETSASTKRQTKRLSHGFGDSGVDLHASVNIENDLNRPTTDKAAESLVNGSRKTRSGEKKEFPFAKVSRLQNQKENSDRLEQTALVVVGKKHDKACSAAVGSFAFNHEKLVSRKRPYTEFSSQSSVSSDENPVSGSPPNLKSRRPSEDTWQLREPKLEQILQDVQQASSRDDRPSNSSSI